MSDIVTITGIAVGGDGVGRLSDGRVVFVPRTAPGDRVRPREASVQRHRNFARAEAGDIVEPSPDRVTPPCPHYTQDHCGGCQLQHLAYDAQLSAKRAIVGDTLRRIGKLDVADPEIVESLDEWRYRSKISLAVKAVGPSGRPTVGLHPYDRPNFVFPLADCHITDFKLMALWRELRPRLALLPQPLTRLTLRLDREERRHIIAESAGEPWLDAEELRGALAGLVDGDVVCWWQPVDGAARVVAGPATGFPATAFEQVNPGMGTLTRQWAVEQLGDVKGQTVWDLYGGVGDTAALLVDKGASVVSVDADEKAVSWGRTRLPNARFIAAKAEDVLPSLPVPHAVVVNPPRGGLHWDVSLRLTSEPVAKLVYISCDPATLARDLSRLNVNYVVKAVRAFDLFPQTAHVETVAVLEAA
ncbi:MAG TPA: class I SAM-dependent RNA methyltransferase [Gemmatimonadales bacterium]|nr:class I SAM-dependent RNA methyltransferase [Gemmatimonadales bacterium]